MEHKREHGVAQRFTAWIIVRSGYPQPLKCGPHKNHKVLALGVQVAIYLVLARRVKVISREWSKGKAMEATMKGPNRGYHMAFGGITILFWC